MQGRIPRRRPAAPREVAPAGKRREQGRRRSEPLPPPRPTPAAGGLRRARQADRARVDERAGEVNDDEEDVVGEMRATGGGAATRDEAGAALVKSLSAMVSVGSL